MTSIAHRGDSLDKLDKRILLALENDVLSAKEICNEWALPESDESRVRYRIRERLGRDEGRLVQIYAADETPGGIFNRNLYSLTDEGREFVRSNRELLATPESIDELRKETDGVQTDALRAEKKAEDAMDVATSQRDRINDLQRDKHTINERSKENRKRLRKLEGEVFEKKCDPSLKQLINEMADDSQRRDDKLERNMEVVKKQLQRTLATRSDLRDVKRSAQKGANGVSVLKDEMQELRERLDETEKENRRLRAQIAEFMRGRRSSGIMRWFYE